MRKSRLSKGKQDKLIEHFVAGATARCAASLIGVNFKTTAYYFRRIRELIAHHIEQEASEAFSGEIELDEKAILVACAKGIVDEVLQERFLYLG